MNTTPESKLNEIDLWKYVTSRRFDIVTPLEEAGFVTPVAFETRDLLLVWAKRHRLSTWPIGKIRPENALLVGHELYPFEGHDYHLYYTQIWVSAKYKDYRSALKRDIVNYVTDDRILRLVDADHVVNKKSAADLNDVWINLLPVWSSHNRGFGWIESRLPRLRKGFQSVFLPPLVAFKILRDRMEKRVGDNRTKETILSEDVCEVVEGLLIHDGKPASVKARVIKFRDALRKDVEEAYNRRRRVTGSRTKPRTAK